MGATDHTPTPALLDPTAAVTTYLDGDTMNRDRIVVEASPGAKPNLTLGLLLSYISGIVMPTASDRGALASNETLVLGHREYHYNEPSADVDVTLPNGSYNRQRIKVWGKFAAPGHNIEFKHAASTTVPATFPTTTSRYPWAVLEWRTSGTPQWYPVEYGGGVTV